MTPQQAIDIGTGALMVAMKLAAPFLLVVLAIGLIVGLLQSVTQIQEQTLAFVPKLLGAALVIALAGSWMLGEIVAFGNDLMQRAPEFMGR